jgi:iron only hydrogenase large subunit-like protein
VEERVKAVYALERSRTIRLSYKNPAVAAVYKDFFGEPGSHKAHELLHTGYAARPVQK